jgi:predicted transglutaminase-like protease
MKHRYEEDDFPVCIGGIDGRYCEYCSSVCRYTMACTIMVLNREHCPTESETEQ